MNKYIEWKGGYVEISAKHDEVINELDLNDPLHQILSEEFVLDVIVNELQHGMMIACYQSPTQNVNLFIEDMSGVLQTDTEDAVITETYVMGQEVLMISKENMYRLNWVDEQKGWIFSLLTTNVSAERTIELCSEIIMLFEDVTV